MGSNPLCRTAVSVTLGPRREAAPRRHRRRRRARASHCGRRRHRLDRLSGRSAEWRADARKLAGKVRSRGRTLAWQRDGEVQCPLDDRPMGSLARCGVRGRGSARRRRTRGRFDTRVEGRQPDLGRSGGRDPLSRQRPRRRPPCVLRAEPGGEDPAARGRGGRLTADRASCRLGRRRVDPAQRAGVRGRDPVRDRAPHGGPEQLLAFPGSRDHARESRSTT